MPLVDCEDCNALVSSESEYCVHCGKPSIYKAFIEVELIINYDAIGREKIDKLLYVIHDVFNESRRFEQYNRDKQKTVFHSYSISSIPGLEDSPMMFFRLSFNYNGIGIRAILNSLLQNWIEESLKNKQWYERYMANKEQFVEQEIVICTHCNGKGQKIDKGVTSDCKACRGSGSVQITKSCPTCFGKGRKMFGFIICSQCNGRGKIEERTICQECKGQKKITSPDITRACYSCKGTGQRILNRLKKEYMPQ